MPDLTETYRRMGVGFDKIYYESQTYLEGKEKVLEGLDKGIMYRKRGRFRMGRPHSRQS